MITAFPNARRLLPDSATEAATAATGIRRVSPLRRSRSASSDGGDLFHFEALDRVSGLDVVVVLERHTALVAFLDLADLVLESLQGLQAAFVNDHVVA